MYFQKLTLVLGLLAVCVGSADAQTDAWLEVRTPHFQIVTNSNEKEGRRVARQFESMCAVFQKVFPDAALDSAAPILVLAVQDKAAMDALEPDQYLANGQARLVGLFVSAHERNYVLILLNAPGTHPYGAVYHEYAHFVFSLTLEWMPVWFSEGIAEFYQNTEILDDEVRLGKGDPNIQYVLEHNPLLPLPTLLAVDHHSPYYHERDKGSVFYAESWALTGRLCSSAPPAADIRKPSFKWENEPTATGTSQRIMSRRMSGLPKPSATALKELTPRLPS
jgi:hypothetical protein